MGRAMSKSRALLTAHPTPQNREACAEEIALIGADQRELTVLEAAMQEAVSGLKRQYEEQAEPLRDRIAARTQSVLRYCEVHRDELCAGGRKFHAFSTGQVSWRHRPPSVRLRNLAEIIDTLRRRGLTQFLREKTEVNKEAMLEESDLARGLPGVSIGSAGEDFIVEPYAPELEQTGQ